VGMSIGIALYPEHGADQQALVLAADKAMYQAKRLGGNRYSLVSEQTGNKPLPENVEKGP